MNEPLDPVELTRTLVAFDTINPPGNERPCAEYLGRLLEDRVPRTKRPVEDAAGVPVTHSDYAGQIHGFWNFTGRIDAAFEARAEACAALSKAFAAV